ncbi:MAG: carbohydrate ABC transporter permease [Candidatus Methylomirabilales bacterium]
MTSASSELAARAPRGTRVRSLWRWYGPQWKYCLAVLGPVCLAYLVIRIIPIFDTAWMSLHNWSLVKPVRPFIGLENYVKLAGDPLFRTALFNTTLFAVVTVPVTLLLAFTVAVLLDRPMRGRVENVYKVLFFLPVVPTMVPVSVVWKWIYDPSYGILNYALGFLGVPPQGWLINAKLAIWAIIAMTVWKSVGYYMVLFLVGLKDIPLDYYEAASIDGATGWQRLWHITIPLMRPMLLFNVVIATIFAYNVFAQVYVMTEGPQGSPANPVRVIVMDMYENGFRYLKMGYASAEAMVLLVIVFALTIVEFRFFRPKV